MRRIARIGLAAVFVIGLLATEWWLSRQLEADVCLDGGHVFDWRLARCDFAATQLPGPVQWYDRLP